MFLTFIYYVNTKIRSLGDEASTLIASNLIAAQNFDEKFLAARNTTNNISTTSHPPNYPPKWVSADV
jgi:hypothetical protein